MKCLSNDHDESKCPNAARPAVVAELNSQTMPPSDNSDTNMNERGQGGGERGGSGRSRRGRGGGGRGNGRGVASSQANTTSAHVVSQSSQADRTQHGQGGMEVEEG